MDADFQLVLLFSSIVGLIILYFIIKVAVNSALNKKFNKYNISQNDIFMIQTKLLIEIAKANGVEKSRLDKILGKDIEKELKPDL